MFKELFNKTIKLAGHKNSKKILGFISFIESFIFPIPPDVLIIPMTIADRQRWMKIAIIATTCLLYTSDAPYERTGVEQRRLRTRS